MATEVETNIDNSGDLPEGWNRTRFDELAKQIADRVDPAETKAKVYIGLEHLDSNTLKIRRYGKPSDVIGQKLAFQIGDVIFGKRRAYQRKLGVAEVNGICSAHAMVLRAIEDAINPEFFPYFLQSDLFMDRAVAISVGSLSPTINWKTLRRQEFPLPPKPLRREIAEQASAIDQTQELFIQCLENARGLLRSLRRQIFADHAKKYGGIKLKSVGHWISGGTPSRSRDEFWNGDFPWVSPKDMKCEVVTNSIERITEVAVNDGVPLVPKDGILLVIRGMILAHTFPVALAGRELTFNQDMKAVVARDAYCPYYIFHWLLRNSQRILTLVADSSHGTKRVPTDVLFAMKIPKPPIDVQEKAVQAFEAQRSAIEKIEEHIQHLSDLKVSLLDSYITGAVGGGA